MAAPTEVTSVLWLVCSRVNRPLGVKEADAVKHPIEHHELTLSTG